MSSLFGMYAKCGMFWVAMKVFDEMPEIDVGCWNTVISCYLHDGKFAKALELFGEMRDCGFECDSVTYTTVISVCAKVMDVERGKEVHDEAVRNGFGSDGFVQAALVDMYGKCGCLDLAVQVFEEIRVKSLVSWNSMIAGYGLRAEYIFKKMPKTNVVEWNLMISGYVAAGSYLESLGIYNDMNAAGIKPDAITFTSILAACSQLGALERGKEIHKCIIEGKFESNEIVMGALLDMYTKCGAVDEAQQVFSQLPERDLISWTTMMTAYGSHGRAFKALKLFQEMQDFNIKPDRVVFLGVISTCSHAGLVKEGRLHEAYAILQGNASIREDVELLSTLFPACHIHGDLELGEKIGCLLVDKTPDDPSMYIVLANMYASLKKWDEARKVRLKMKELGLRKNPGCTWIEIDKKIVPFLVEDKSIPQAGFVYQCLSVLAGHMNKDELLFDKTISNM
ncbi:tetratricopeptide repeat (TPR)-like superfamily protein [Artemisia annua]|uniref:Tetratricopeptide repeat (TPR)-like superfamily protein n=1 Tax=Artemisia annua TaxID=35608 RepID=A0A2U1M0L3_ARTAN|nr:tetratricopeptide repeat (TPR)-like superfamily protein [Artemisia annua]